MHFKQVLCCKEKTMNDLTTRVIFQNPTKWMLLWQIYEKKLRLSLNLSCQSVSLPICAHGRRSAVRPTFSEIHNELKIINNLSPLLSQDAHLLSTEGVMPHLLASLFSATRISSHSTQVVTDQNCKTHKKTYKKNCWCHNHLPSTAFDFPSLFTLQAFHTGKKRHAFLRQLRAVAAWRKTISEWPEMYTSEEKHTPVFNPFLLWSFEWMTFPTNVKANTLNSKFRGEKRHQTWENDKDHQANCKKDQERGFLVGQTTNPNVKSLFPGDKSGIGQLSKVQIPSTPFPPNTRADAQSISMC